MSDLTFCFSEIRNSVYCLTGNPSVISSRNRIREQVFHETQTVTSYCEAKLLRGDAACVSLPKPTMSNSWTTKPNHFSVLPKLNPTSWPVRLGEERDICPSVPPVNHSFVRKFRKFQRTERPEFSQQNLGSETVWPRVRRSCSTGEGRYLCH